MNTEKPWNTHDVKKLEHLWNNTGLSAEGIAKEFNDRYSRNAIIAKAHRLNLAQRGTPIKRHKKTNDAAAAHKAKIKAIAVDPDMAVTGLINLKNNQCHFIYDTAGGGRRYCGRPTDPESGKDYCPEHCAIIFQPPKPPKTKGENQ